MGAFSPAFEARLDELAIRGTFEAHLTIETMTVERRAAFEALCAELGIDHVGIELREGAHRAQPMTASRHRGELAAVMAEVDALHARIAAAGFAIVRVKLEAMPANEGVPTEDGYHEFHVKVRVADPGALAALAALAARYGGRLSRNDRRHDAAGAQRFVTLRVYRESREAAEARLDALLGALAAAGHAVAGTVREYTIYDSRIELDAGWLEPPP
jgi:hypothetical protein